MYSLKNMILLKIEGKNIKNFILNLRNKKIHLYEINIINRKTAYIKIYYVDYLKILKYKGTYKISKIKEQGLINLKHQIKSNIPFLIGISLSFLILFILSNIIFKIEIIHTNKEIKNIIISELNDNGIKKYNFKKSYINLEKTKKNILNKYKDKLEWIEIIEQGTSYKVKLEMRKIINPIVDNQASNIIAKKNAVIKKIIASNGLIMKKVNDYVSKGDIIISGNIFKDDTIVSSLKARGKVFGEVWYTVNVEYPFNYQEDILEDKYQYNFKIKFLNNNFYFINRKFKNYKEYNRTMLKSNKLPLSFGFVKLQKIKRKDEIYNYDQALKQALEVSKKKLMSSLGKEDKILSQKTLKNYQKDSKIVVDIFYSVYEDITDNEVIIIEEKIGE